MPEHREAEESGSTIGSCSLCRPWQSLCHYGCLEGSVYEVSRAKKAERNDKIVKSREKVTRINMELTPEKRNFSFTVYKNVTRAKRAF